MKICTNCNNYLEDEAVFCDRCGASLPSDDGSSAEEQMNYSQQLYGQQYTPQYTQQGYTQEQPMYVSSQYGEYEEDSIPYQPSEKKGLKGWHIVLIVVGTLVILGVVIGLIMGNSSSEDEEYDSYDDYSYEEETEYEEYDWEEYDIDTSGSEYNY